MINKWRNSSFDEPNTFGERADVLWHVRESQRLVSLGIIAPELLTFEEQQIWALIEENGHFWRGRWCGKDWEFSVRLDTIVRERVDENWEDLVAVAIGEKKPDALPGVGAPPSSRGFDDEVPF